jgi:peptidoglycan/xylan/chitin deacetylase (PgdA/CDA1 family)
VTSLRETFVAESDMIAGLLAAKPLIRALNFHNTPARRQADFDRQLAQCARHFAPVDEGDLERYLSTGGWHKDRPGILLAFYEGYRNGYDVIRPLLEKHGLTGWFFVITGFVDAPVGEQLAYAEAHGIGMETREYEDGRYALSWDEIRELDGRHVIASHARSHRTIAEMSQDDMRAEVLGSQARFRAELGHPVQTFVSWGGPAYGEHAPSDRLVDGAGYRLQVSNFRIQRLRDQ